MTAFFSRRSPLGGRRGIALAAVLLITVALSVMAHAALLLSRTEVLITRSEVRRLEGTYQATASIAAVEADLDSLPWTGPLPAPWGSVEALRLGAELVLLRVPIPGIASGEGRARVLWAPHPPTRLRRRTAAVVVGGAVVRALGAVLAPSDPGAPCPEGTAPPPGLLTWARPSSGDLHPALGPVTMGELLIRLPPAFPGTLPLDSVLARGVPGSLAVTGTGRGVLVVEGDLVLGEGAALEGWVWVGGDLVIQGGATFTGMADVGGDLLVEAGAEVRADACVAAGALVGTGALRRPWGIGPLAWPSP